MDSKGGEEVPEMSFEELMKAFIRMKDMVEDMYFKSHPNEEEESSVKGEGGGEGGDPSKPSSPSYGNGANEHSSKDKKSSHTHNLLPNYKPLLKLDVKFVLPIYDGELNAEKYDNWVK
jgi:hypothetical protein